MAASCSNYTHSLTVLCFIVLIRLPASFTPAGVFIFNNIEADDYMYSIVVGTYCLEGVTYVGYGIGGDNVEFTDITCDKTAMQDFVDLCNAAVLDSVHLKEVIEDFWLTDNLCEEETYDK